MIDARVRLDLGPSPDARGDAGAESARGLAGSLLLVVVEVREDASVGGAESGADSAAGGPAVGDPAVGHADAAADEEFAALEERLGEDAAGGATGGDGDGVGEFDGGAGARLGRTCGRHGDAGGTGEGDDETRQ